MLDVDSTSGRGGQLNRQPAPKLPLDVFGDRWAQSIDDAARSAVGPADYVVAPLLAAASVLIGNARWAQAWKGRKEPPHLWCATVGDSGVAMSPGADAITHYVLAVIERRMGADFPDQLREAQTSIEDAKARQEAALPPQPGPVPREPIEPVLMMSDTTIKRVAFLLATAAPKGVLLTRDELAGGLLGMNTGLMRSAIGKARGQVLAVAGPGISPLVRGRRIRRASGHDQQRRHARCGQARE
jgi:hypothetical protein